jgi:predicted esterase
MTHARFRRRIRAAFAVAALSLPALLSSASAQTAAGDPPAAETLWLAANNWKLKTSVYESAPLSSHPVLVVVLHGDLVGVFGIPTTTYHYVFADEATRKVEDVVVAAVLRPGYRDHSGERSDGDQGTATGDNYTPEVVDAIAAVIERLKARFRPSHTVLVGHSGGAAISGDLLGRWPSAADGALLASCPCDLRAFRKHMMRMQPDNPLWSKPVRSLSPQELVGQVSPRAHVVVLVGAEDDVAPPSLSTNYAEALKKHGAHVTLTIAPDLGHEILWEPVTYEALKRLVQDLRRSRQTVQAFSTNSDLSLIPPKPSILQSMLWSPSTSRMPLTFVHAFSFDEASLTGRSLTTMTVSPSCRMLPLASRITRSGSSLATGVAAEAGASSHSCAHSGQTNIGPSR